VDLQFAQFSGSIKNAKGGRERERKIHYTLRERFFNKKKLNNNYFQEAQFHN
jgi:hypothetical protein